MDEVKRCTDYIRDNIGFKPMSDAELARLESLLCAILNVSEHSASAAVTFHTDTTEYLFEVARSCSKVAYNIHGQRSGTINDAQYRSAATMLGLRGEHDLVKQALMEREQRRSEAVEEKAIAGMY
ncbi:hypothetical protein L2750_14545 [Shewanella submarina]|uniref:Uncharacterized protein n=1 Tax=Shewanella submarina TaxID=2016376 RepID=A0ABV7G9F0_9GAMM|nr:hypothetical protein [Shewanella submarina]MCL1038350.1 hypothetical protein [Shewanella submarina]